MVLGTIFWVILGLGLAIPATILVILNSVVKIMAGDQYQLDFVKFSMIYLGALLGWAIFFGTIF